MSTLPKNQFANSCSLISRIISRKIGRVFRHVMTHAIRPVDSHVDRHVMRLGLARSCRFAAFTAVFGVSLFSLIFILSLLTTSSNVAVAESESSQVSGAQAGQRSSSAGRQNVLSLLNRSFSKPSFSSASVSTSTAGVPTVHSTHSQPTAKADGVASMNASILKLRMPVEPRTLNPISADGMAAGDIQAYVIETLLRRDENDQSWQPALADSWSEESNGRAYIFHIRSSALWSDGVPVSAEDVKFSFDVLFDDRFQTAMMRAYYSGIESVEIRDPQTVVFHTKDTYYANFNSSAQISIVPKHIYENPAKFDALQATLIGSGPYRMKQWNHGQSLKLEKNPKWWGYNGGAQTAAARYRVEEIRFVFVSNDQTAIELLKHGDLDFSWLTPDQFLSQASPRFESVRVQNSIPKTVKSIAFNLDRPLFKDQRVRQALSLLADRKGMIEHLFHGFMLPATGPWYRQSFYADENSPELTYNPAQSYKLLRDAGWRLDSRTRLLVKDIDGVIQPLRFTILMMKEDDQRYLTIFQESARQIGVDVKLQLLNPTSFNAALIARRFDAADVDHGAVLVEFDPRSTWNSGRLPPNGFNYAGYSDSVSDHLISIAMQERNLEKRIPVMKALYRQIASVVPEIFLFNESDSFYAVSPRVVGPNPTQKYDLGLSSWAVESSLSQLADAGAMPPRDRPMSPMSYGRALDVPASDGTLAAGANP